MVGLAVIAASVTNGWDALWLDWLLKATLLLSIAWTLHLALARANPHYRVLVWRLAIVGLLVVPAVALVAPEIDVPLPSFPQLADEFDFSELPATSDNERGARAEGIEFATGMVDIAADYLARGAMIMEHGGAISAFDPPLPPEPAGELADQVNDQPASAPAAAGWSWSQIALAVWILGIVVLVARLAPAVRRVRKVLANSSVAPPALQREFDKVAAGFGLRRRPELRVTSDLAMPIVVGAWRPVLLLPDYFAASRFIRDLPAVFAHELSHARSHDILWDYLFYGLTACLWFHPLCWRASSAHLKSCEDVCDVVSANYVGDIRSYSGTLARVALIVRARLAAASLPVVGGLPMARTSEIKRRLARLRTGALWRRPARRYVLAGVGASVALTALVAGLNFGYANSATRFVLAAVEAPDSWTGDLSPISAGDWNYARAAHLLERAGFGGTPEEIERLSRLSPEQAVSELLDYETQDNGHLPAFEESHIYDQGVAPFSEENVIRAAINEGRQQGYSLGVLVDFDESLPLQPVVDEAYYHVYASRLESRRVALWWANRMLNSRRPLEEKLSLFWHSHFAVNYERVGDYRKLLSYLETLHQHANGDFSEFLLAIAQEPAMLVYLDNGLNVQGSPNENFARELLELFTLGSDAGFSERDVRETARAFTGWTQDDLQFVARDELHDAGTKTIFGQRGNFDGAGAIDLIVRQPQTARRVTRKLYNYFVSDQIPANVADDLATQFRETKFQIKPVLRTIFLSKDFYSSASVSTQIKSPAHLIVSTCKKLGLTEIPGVPDFRAAMVALGQEMLAPANVAGWEGGRAWINPATLLERGNYLANLLYGEPEDAEGLLRPSAAGEPDRPRLPPTAESEQLATSTANRARNERYDTNEGYVLSLGVQHGTAKANQRVKGTTQARAAFDAAAIAEMAGARTAAEAVDYFTLRFLRLPLTESARQSLVDFVRLGLRRDRIDYRSPEVESVLRELIYQILCTPEYQLS